MAIFADVVRKILILQTTKPLWTSDAAKWKGDIKEIATERTAEIGIAHFVRAALKPLEAQGRGFSHDHEKVISVPRTRAARLKKID